MEQTNDQDLPRAPTAKARGRETGAEADRLSAALAGMTAQLARALG